MRLGTTMQIRVTPEMKKAIDEMAQDLMIRASDVVRMILADAITRHQELKTAENQE